jgi:hypothetical protein
MAWVRAGQLSAETQTLADVAGLNGSGYDISSTQKYTGSYSYRLSGTDAAFGIAGLAATAARCNFMFRHNGQIVSNQFNSLIGMAVDGAYLVWFWNPTSNEIQLYAGYVSNTSTRYFPVSVISNAFANVNTWYSIGMIANIAEVGGFVTLYADGQQVATWTGDTRLYRSGQTTPRTQINAVYAAGYGSNWGLSAITAYTGLWANYAYIDDFYADYYTGGAPADYPPSTRRFVPAFPIADTATADWTPNTGSDHYAMVDEAPPDDDTTRLKADGAGLTDIFNFSTVSVPSPDWSVRAAVVVAYARKTDANFDSTLRLVQEYDGTVEESDERQLGVSYNNVWGRWEAPPGEETWTEARINQANFGIRSDGSFSDYG